jgi:hypothetical protein
LKPKTFRGPLGLNLQEPRAAIKTPFGVRAHPRLAKKTIGGGTSGGQSGACNPVLEAAAAGLGAVEPQAGSQVPVTRCWRRQQLGWSLVGRLVSTTGLVLLSISPQITPPTSLESLQTFPSHGPGQLHPLTRRRLFPCSATTRGECRGVLTLAGGLYRIGK